MKTLVNFMPVSAFLKSCITRVCSRRASNETQKKEGKAVGNLLIDAD